MLSERNWPRDQQRDRNVALLVSLVVMFVLYPVMVKLDAIRFYRLIIVVELIVASISLGTKKRHSVLAVAMGGPAILLQLFAFSSPSRGSLLIAAILTQVFLVFVIIVVYRQLWAPGKVTTDKLAAAVNVYLLLGLGWAFIYGLIALFDHGAFTTTTIDFHTLEEYLHHGAEFVFVYFSFVTLTTLGYGDVLPATSAAQTATWMEAVAGQLFVAVTIARLVGLLGREHEVPRRQSQVDSD
jgi:hypothetical protein